MCLALSTHVFLLGKSLSFVLPEWNEKASWDCCRLQQSVNTFVHCEALLSPQESARTGVSLIWGRVSVGLQARTFPRVTVIAQL